MFYLSVPLPLGTDAGLPDFAASLAALSAAFLSISFLWPFLMTGRIGAFGPTRFPRLDLSWITRLEDLSRHRIRLDTKPAAVISKIVDGLNLKSILDAEQIRVQLRRAGLHGQSPLYVFLFLCVAMPVTLALITFCYLVLIVPGQYLASTQLLIFAISLGFGAYIPYLGLRILVERRQAAIRDAFPDALDMLLVCVRSGMTIEAALARVAVEIRRYSRELEQEFSLIVADLAYGRDRGKAFENFAARTTLPGAHAIAKALAQAERYGTSIGHALKSTASEYRRMRLHDAERRAAALPAKLTVPMVIFFLPALFVVILGPALIRMSGAE